MCVNIYSIVGPDVQHYRKVHEIVKLTRELYLVSYRFVEAFTHIVLFLIMLYISEINMEILVRREQMIPMRFSHLISF